jgi:hypothetical protein
MKPTRKVTRRSFISEVTGGYGAAGGFGGPPDKPVPATDHDLHPPQKPGAPASDSDH